MSEQDVPYLVFGGMWGVVELMGHVTIGGRISFENGMWRCDVPQGDEYSTEYYGPSAIYRIRYVSEKIARSYATSAAHEIMSYDAPVISREEHETVIERLNEERSHLAEINRELMRRLTAVNALPGPREEKEQWTPD